MSINFGGADRERLSTAVEFYISRCTWASDDEEKAEFERVLAYLNGSGPRAALVEALRDGGMEAEWAGYTADEFYDWAGPDADRMTRAMLTDDGKADLIDRMLNDNIDIAHADHLVESLATVMKDNATKAAQGQDQDDEPEADLRSALLESLAGHGHASAGWDEFIVEKWIDYTGEGREQMTPTTRTAFTDYVVRPGVSRAEADFLIDRLTWALEQTMTKTQEDHA